jgi:hypothetical protein
MGCCLGSTNRTAVLLFCTMGGRTVGGNSQVTVVYLFCVFNATIETDFPDEEHQGYQSFHTCQQAK